MKKFTVLDFLIFTISILIGILVYLFDICISEKIISALITVPFILVALLLSISALIVNSWERDIVQKLIQSNHYYDLLFTLKIVSYILIFSGSITIAYGVLFQIVNKVAFSAVILIFFSFSIGYLIKNIKRIFLILEYLGKP